MILSASLNTNIAFKHVLRFGVELFHAEEYILRWWWSRCLLFVLYVFMLYIWHYKKTVTVNKGLSIKLSCYIFLYKIFVLTCVMMACEKFDTSSIQLKTQFDFK
jgi:hypothetical protein